MTPENLCDWCRKPVLFFQPQIERRGPFGIEVLHLDCVADEDDEVFFDRDMEFGDR
jgi:hypothetical protein